MDDVREASVRFSSLRAMARSPIHYVSAVLDGREDTLSMRLGRGTHAVLLGQPVAVFTGKVRRGKDWEAFRADSAGKEILNQREYDQARRIADSVHANDDATKLLFSPQVRREQRITWEFLGRECSGTPDAANYGYWLAELKSTVCSDPRRFERDGKFRAYHAQVAWYRRGMIEAGLGTPPDSFFIAVESTRPYPATVMRLTDRAIDQGERLCRLWMERLLACERANHWPGYVESIVDFDVEDSDFSLTIDGETVGFGDETPAPMPSLDSSNIDEMDAIF
jgi:exodeoxyribonuclease VIII